MTHSLKIMRTRGEMYNENEPFAIRWLEQLQDRDLIPKGEIDGRSINDLTAADCGPTSHFFAGIGGWAYALQLAGWNPARPVWTGSAPCQPFSIAGAGSGFSDSRHLWPIWYELIKECKPPVIFGEQTASKLGREWLSGVRFDLETLGYAVGAADLCAASVGAPHIRQRLYWAAYSESRRISIRQEAKREIQSSRSSKVGRVGDSNVLGLPREYGRGARKITEDGRGYGWLVDSNGKRCETGSERTPERFSESFWSDFDIIPSGNGKTRRIESGTTPLAHGVPRRVGRIRGYGNAIVPQLAATFIRSFLEAEEKNINA